MTQSLKDFRNRLAERGHKRVEVSVATADVELIRRVARALAKDRATAERVRRVMQDLVPTKPALKFKDWVRAP